MSSAMTDNLTDSYTKEYSSPSRLHGKRTRRRINQQQIEIGNLGSNSGKKQYSRGSSEDRSDYNVDSDNDDTPIITNKSIQFNQPINQKGGVMNSMSSHNSKQDYTPDRHADFKASIDNSKPDDKRASDLVEFQTPGGNMLSPIGYNSTEAKFRGRPGYPADDAGSASDSSDQYKLGGGLNQRQSRPQDVSPHNRDAKPRSSCIRKSMLKTHQSIDQSSPKRVHFKAGLVEESLVDPTNLDAKLSEHAHTTSYQRYENNENYEKQVSNPVREVNRNEFESRYNSQNNDERDPKFGQRLRSHERLLQPDHDSGHHYSSHQNTSYERRKPRTAQEQISENTTASISLNNSKNSFQMKNIVKNTEYRRHEAKQSPARLQTTIPEVSSKYEESRDETSYLRGSKNLGPRGTRTRSPFNMGSNMHDSYDSRVVSHTTKYSPAKGTYRTVYDQPEIVVQQPVLTQRQNIIEPVVREQVVEYREPVRMAPADPYVVRRTSSPPRMVERMSSPRRMQPNTVVETEYRREPVQDSFSSQPRTGSPRETRSPRRSPRRQERDPKSELAAMSRFFMNNILLKTVENLVFETVPEIYHTQKNQSETIHRVGNEPSFEFSRGPSQVSAQPQPQQQQFQSVAGMDDDDDDTSEGSVQINTIIGSKNKKGLKNDFVKSRYMDSFGIKFDGKKEENGIKALPYQETQNLPMISAKPIDKHVKKMPKGDLWDSETFELIKYDKGLEGHKTNRPYLTSKEVIEAKTDIELDELPYVNEKIFKVSKGITQHLADLLKTNAGLFDETVEIRFLRNLRQKAEDSEKNNKNIRGLELMLDSVNQITNDSKGNEELHWVFVFSKRLQGLIDNKLDVLHKKKQTEAQTKTESVQENIRNSFINNSNLRLTNSKDKLSQSINFDDVKSALTSPYRNRGTQNDPRLKDLKIRKRKGMGLFNDPEFFDV